MHLPFQGMHMYLHNVRTSAWLYEASNCFLLLSTAGFDEGFFYASSSLSVDLWLAAIITYNHAMPCDYRDDTLVVIVVVVAVGIIVFIEYVYIIYS